MPPDASCHRAAGTDASTAGHVQPVTWNRPARGGLAALAARRAEALIVANAGEPLSVGDLARAVGVSVRSLCRGFRHLRGYGPTEAVRRARLLRVRHDLLTAGGRERVTDIAMRWGFCHLGRFSQVYAAHFGELPSETRRRSLTGSPRGRRPKAAGA